MFLMEKMYFEKTTTIKTLVVDITSYVMMTISAGYFSAVLTADEYKDHFFAVLWCNLILQCNPSVRTTLKAVQKWS